ncbi:hypothetical protein CE91St19_20050 [Odoribacter laneus]|nr:hypothetical protein CE91St19_20050 [Odoribacter laneus]GKI25046.1 hypothetical protein CE91St20_11830 [Odoribacter laneus]
MHMKTEIMKYFVLLFCFSLAACDSDDKTKNVPDLNIVSSGLTIKAAGGTGTIEVETPGSWHAESNKDWCTLTTSGNQITVSVPENLSLSSRTAQITITSPQKTKTIPVNQEGIIIILSQPELTLGYSGDPKNLLVESNIGWNAAVEAGWCHLEKTGDTLKISAEPYSANINRETQITLTAGDYTQTVKVTQRFKGAFVLDRWSDTNLGATLPATEANVNSANYRDTWGNFYQWGRNVGFPHGVTYKVITTNPSITAESAQTMSEFIGSSETMPMDWLIDGSRTTKPASGNSYTWKDRAGSDPSPAGWHIPLDYEASQIFPIDEFEGRYSRVDRLVNKEVLEADGTEYTCVSTGDGNRTRYAIKKYGTNEAYILRYEFIEPDGINSYLKITEIKGDAYTDFQDALEAEKLFEAAKESAVLLFPSCGYLYTNTGGPNSEGVSGSYWTASPVNEYTVYVSIGNWQTHIDANYCPRALGCSIRCVKDEE